MKTGIEAERSLRLEKWALVAEIVGGVAILISLAVLIIEVRSNTEAVRAQTAYAQRAAETDRRLGVIHNTGGIAELVLKGSAGQELDPVEEFRLMVYYNEALDSFEWQFREAQAGRLPMNQLNTRVWRIIWNTEPGIADVYEESMPFRDPQFVQFWETNIAGD